jgi:ribonuclease-3
MEKNTYIPALKSIAQLEKIIDYSFNNKNIIKNALTHSSYSNENKHKDKHIVDNERLEFLGDSVLSIITSEYLYSLNSAFDEGDLTKTRAAVVCENSLYEFATQISLGDYIFLGHGEVLTHGRGRKSIVSDAFEALLGALYLDGGMETAKRFLLPFIENATAKAFKSGNGDYKSLLQKIVQQTPEEILEYRLISESGPPHNKWFTFHVYLNSNFLGEGSGKSKRIAEQEAAKEALIILGEEV